jgi:hypothetical protein
MRGSGLWNPNAILVTSLSLQGSGGRHTDALTTVPNGEHRVEVLDLSVELLDATCEATHRDLGWEEGQVRTTTWPQFRDLSHEVGLVSVFEPGSGLAGKSGSPRALTLPIQWPHEAVPVGVPSMSMWPACSSFAG